MRRRVTQLTKNGLNAQQQSLHDCKIPQRSRESWQKHCVFRLCLGLSTQILEVEYKQAYKMIDTGVLVWKSKNIKSYQPNLFYFGSKMHKAKWWTLVSYGISNWMSNNVKNACKKVGENWATLSQFDDSHTQIQTLYYCFTEAYPVSIHWWVVDAILLLCWNTACFITLLSFTQHFYIAELPLSYT